MSRRSNRTRGNRPLNMGAGLRSRQMTPKPVQKRPAGTIGNVSDDAILDELGMYLVTEITSEMMIHE